MHKDRLKHLKQIANSNYADRHDSPQMYFTGTDLKWLIEQAEKVEQLQGVIEVDRHEYHELNKKWKKVKEENEYLVDDLECEKFHLLELEKQTERYEKALKRITFDESVTFEQAEIIAKRALKIPPFNYLD